MDAGPRAAPVELPLACTLGPDDAAARLNRWQLLAERISAPRSNAGVIGSKVRWQLQAGVREQLEALAAAERRCWSCVSWCVSLDGADMVLYVTAEENRPGDVAPIAVLFGAG